MADLVPAPRPAVSNDIPPDVMAQVLADKQKPIKWFPGVGDALKSGAHHLWQDITNPYQTLKNYASGAVKQQGVLNPFPIDPGGVFHKMNSIITEPPTTPPTPVEGMFNTPSQQLQQMATGK